MLVCLHADARPPGVISALPRLVTSAVYTLLAPGIINMAEGRQAFASCTAPSLHSPSLWTSNISVAWKETSGLHKSNQFILQSLNMLHMHSDIVLWSLKLSNALHSLHSPFQHLIICLGLTVGHLSLSRASGTLARGEGRAGGRAGRKAGGIIIRNSLRAGAAHHAFDRQSRVLFQLCVSVVPSVLLPSHYLCSDWCWKVILLFTRRTFSYVAKALPFLHRAVREHY